jgi:hypothetical protein
MNRTARAFADERAVGCGVGGDSAGTAYGRGDYHHTVAVQSKQDAEKPIDGTADYDLTG